MLRPLLRIRGILHHKRSKNQERQNCLHSTRSGVNTPDLTGVTLAQVGAIDVTCATAVEAKRRVLPVLRISSTVRTTVTRTIDAAISWRRTTGLDYSLRRNAIYDRID